MDIYKEMYYRLFNRTCDIMKNTTDKYAEYMIRRAHLETEEMFMNYEEACKPVINLLEYKKEKGD